MMPFPTLDEHSMHTIHLWETFYQNQPSFAVKFNFPSDVCFEWRLFREGSINFSPWESIFYPLVLYAKCLHCYSSNFRKKMTVEQNWTWKTWAFTEVHANTSQEKARMRRRGLGRKGIHYLYLKPFSKARRVLTEELLQSLCESSLSVSFSWLRSCTEGLSPFPGYLGGLL